MPLDGISCKFLSLELSADLKDARVDRITQPGRFDLFFVLRIPGANRRLFISCNPSSPRAYLLPSGSTAPAAGSKDRQPPMFCMLLRKHLQGARLLSVSSRDFERLLDFTFQVRNEYGDLTERRLVCELMGRHSNIILLNENGRILDALVHVDGSVSSRREIMPARSYTLPPSQGKLRPDELLKQLEGGQEPDFFKLPQQNLDRLLLDHIAGLAPAVCREICLRAGLDPDRASASLTPAELEHLTGQLKAFLAPVLSGQSSPCLIYGNGLKQPPTDFHALPLTHAGEIKQSPSLSAAMSCFYPQKDGAQRLQQQKNNLSKQVQKAIRHQVKLLGIYDRDLKSGRDYDRYRRLGDLIYSNLHLIQPGLQSATVTDYSSPNNEAVTVELKPERSPSQNAQRYYRLYQKNKSRFESALSFKEKAEGELNYLRTLLTMVETAESSREIGDLKAEWQVFTERDQHKGLGPDKGKAGKKKARAGKAAKKENRQAPLPPRRFTSTDGFTILVGRNNRQNEDLTLRKARKDDLWLHLQMAPGTHVIIRTEGQEVPDRTIAEAAGLAAWFSLSETKRKEAGSGSKVNVDFCPAAHVKKPAGARPGMVIYDRYRTITVKPLAPANLPETD